MSFKTERNIYICIGLLLIIFIEVTILIPYVNILLAIGCFYKAYKINKLIKSENKCDIDNTEDFKDKQY